MAGVWLHPSPTSWRRCSVQGVCLACQLPHTLELHSPQPAGDHARVGTQKAVPENHTAFTLQAGCVSLCGHRTEPPGPQQGFLM